MPVTLNPITSTMLSARFEPQYMRGPPGDRKRPQEQQVASTEPTDRTASGTYIAIMRIQGFVILVIRHWARA